MCRVSIYSAEKCCIILIHYERATKQTMEPTHSVFGLGVPHEFAILMVLLFLIALPTVFWIVELVDAARREYSEPNLKVVWLLVIFFAHFLGAVIYYFVGKKQGVLPNAGANRV